METGFGSRELKSVFLFLVVWHIVAWYLRKKCDIFADGINADREATDYKHTYRRVTSDDKLQIHLAPGGGWTAIVE